MIAHYKLMSVMALLIAPTIIVHYTSEAYAECVLVSTLHPAPQTPNPAP